MTFFSNRKRLFAVGLLAAALLGLNALVVTPLMGLYRAGEQRIDLLRERALRVSASRETRPVWQQKLAELERSGQAGAVFWPGATDEVAAAALQQRVRGLIRDSGALIGETEAIPPSSAGPFREIALKVRFSADIDQVLRIVHGAESMKPSLAVKRLSLHRASVTKPDAPELNVELELKGLAQPSAGRPAA